MANEVVVTSASGCEQILPNGTPGMVLGILPSGVPGWQANNAGGPSTDAGDILATGSDGLAYLSCESVQDCVGAAIAAGSGLTYNDAANSISAKSLKVEAGPDPVTVTTGPLDLFLGDTIHFWGNTVDFTVTPGSVDVEAEVKISPNAGNSLIANANGLYVPTAAFVNTPLTVVDTPTVDLTASGTDNHTLQAAVKISATAGNQIVANADGIFVTADVQTPLTVNDSSTFDFTASGTDNHTLTGSVINDPLGGLSATIAGEKVLLDPAAGNLLTVSAAGLKATFVETTLTVTDTSTVDLTAAGTNGHAIQAAVKVSATAGNAITTNVDGLYVATSSFSNTPLTVNDSTSVDLTTSGTDNHTLTAAVINDPAGGLTVSLAGEKIKLDPAVGNLLTVSAAGLKAIFTETTLTVTDTSTVDLTAAGTNGHSIQAAVKLSATAGNTLVANADGLFVPAATALDQNGLTLVGSANELGGTLLHDTTIAQAGFTLNLTNTGAQDTGINMTNVNGNGFVKVETTGNVNLGTVASGRVQFITNSVTRAEIFNSGLFLIEGTGAANTSGLRFANLTNASPCTAGSALLGVDAAGNVVNACPCEFRGRLPYRSVSANTTLNPATDGVIDVSAAGGNVSIALTAPTACQPNDFYIRRTDNSANMVTLTSGALIDGAASKRVCFPMFTGSLHLVYTGASWIVI